MKTYFYQGREVKLIRDGYPWCRIEDKYGIGVGYVKSDKITVVDNGQ
jgi:hypothetical protein